MLFFKETKMSDHPEYFPVPAEIAKHAKINRAKYDAMYAESVKDPVKFWGEQGKRLDWIKPYTQVKDVDFKDNARIRWYYDGVLNVTWPITASTATCPSARTRRR
jgi:acetyl-CoA synthetase